VLGSLAAGAFRLTYLRADWEDSVRRRMVEQAGARLVDRKVTFRKALPFPAPPWPAGIRPFRGPVPTPGLEALALASGLHSRFRLDPSVPSGVFETLYLTWIRRSVRKELADEVLVADGETAFLTLSREGEDATIGLVAVGEPHRGRGLGKALMAAAEAWGAEHGGRFLSVVTQGGNPAACALYRAAGCALVREEAIYHLWTGPS